MHATTLFLSALVFVAQASAVVLTSPLTARQSPYPACATPCMQNADYGSCQPTELSCLCSNQAFLDSTAQCIYNTCTDPSDLAKALAISQAACLSVHVTLTSTYTPTQSRTASAAPSTSVGASTTAAGSSASSAASSASSAASSAASSGSSAASSATSAAASSASSVASSVSQSASAAASTPSSNSASALTGSAALGLAGVAAVFAIVL